MNISYHKCLDLLSDLSLESLSLSTFTTIKQNHTKNDAGSRGRYRSHRNNHIYSLGFPISMLVLMQLHPLPHSWFGETLFACYLFRDLTLSFFSLNPVDIWLLLFYKVYHILSRFPVVWAYILYSLVDYNFLWGKRCIIPNRKYFVHFDILIFVLPT